MQEIFPGHLCLSLKTLCGHLKQKGAKWHIYEREGKPALASEYSNISRIV